MRLILQALLHSLFFSAISAAAISPGSTLFASNKNQSWLSPNKTFSLHFIPVQPPTSPPSFIAAIVFSGGVPIIWSAGNGASVDEFGSLQFLSTGSLRLVNGSGATVWDSGTSNMGVSFASLGDDGNLVLSNGTGIVFSSFENPTDTIVPYQNFTVGKVLKSGLYSFKMQSNLGNLVLSWNGSVSYWDKRVNSSLNGSLTWPVLRIQQTGVLSIHDPNLTSSTIVSYSSDHAEGSDVLRILRLDNDGNLRIYSSSRGSGSETIRWAAIEDQCEVFGYCGKYGICSYKNLIPICKCPSQNFEMIDPNDNRKGCKRIVELENCQGKIEMLQLDHALIFSYPPIPIFSANPEVLYIPNHACRANCLGSDSCFASTSLSDGTGICYIKNVDDLISGYQNAALLSTSYVKVCGPLAPNPPPFLETRKCNDWGKHAWIIVVLVLGTILAFIAFESGFWLWCRRNRMRLRGLSGHYALLEYASSALVQVSYEELYQATMGFREKLGAGPFGAVYRGVLADTIVAVKQLEGIEQVHK
ncbi:hypothetical protein L6164_023560 [Bauhinia variegata]|uniref:Uncharacterized protein n=1 Tax=Bauhinia variegata TaxID=167791 RepID=A0ACB9MIX8_BAUVA|nr:hypothetical protein L6164_023560 [Bauhinia variegata]